MWLLRGHTQNGKNGTVLYLTDRKLLFRLISFIRFLNSEGAHFSHSSIVVPRVHRIKIPLNCLRYQFRLNLSISGPGKMNQDDFMDLMASQIRANASDRNADNLSAQIVQFLMDTFRMFDQDKDGYISKEELAVSFSIEQLSWWFVGTLFSTTPSYEFYLVSCFNWAQYLCTHFYLSSLWCWYQAIATLAPLLLPTPHSNDPDLFWLFSLRLGVYLKKWSRSTYFSRVPICFLTHIHIT